MAQTGSYPRSCQQTPLTQRQTLENRTEQYMSLSQILPNHSKVSMTGTPVTLNTTGSRPSAAVRYPDRGQNLVWRNVVGSVAARLMELGTQQAPTEHCTELRKPWLRFRLATTHPTLFRLATTRPALLTSPEESEPALGE